MWRVLQFVILFLIYWFLSEFVKYEVKDLESLFYLKRKEQ